MMLVARLTHRAYDSEPPQSRHADSRKKSVHASQSLCSRRCTNAPTRRHRSSFTQKLRNYPRSSLYPNRSYKALNRAILRTSCRISNCYRLSNCWAIREYSLSSSSNQEYFLASSYQVHPCSLQRAYSPRMDSFRHGYSSHSLL